MRSINLLRFLCLSLVSLSLAGCIAAMHISKSDFEDKLAHSPYLLDKVNPPAQGALTKSSDIQLFYKLWNAFTKPNRIVNWEHHFMINKASSPAWSYSTLSGAEHYLRKIDDKAAIQTLQELASKNGGDALVDLHREPVIDNDSLPAKIRGYKYIASIVKKD